MTYFDVDSGSVGQRVDNFLITRLKGLPKTRVYRAIRKGEVRVNGSRIKPCYNLQLGDRIRIPPLRLSTQPKFYLGSDRKKTIIQSIIFEDDDLIVINKPSGFPVHGGTGINGGLIELMRLARPDLRYLELVHRLDKGTSGCLLLAKKRTSLLFLQKQFMDRVVDKTYILMVNGCFQSNSVCVNKPLRKHIKKDGQRVVMVDSTGKDAKTYFKPLKVTQDYSLLEAKIITGRTHQIRVHCSYINHPIAGDDHYGDRDFNKKMHKKGLSNIFLHCSKISLTYPSDKRERTWRCPLPAPLSLLVSDLFDKNI